MSKICVFDLDGTLANTAPDLISALNRVLQDQNLPAADYEDARAFVGHGARVLIERAHRAQGIELSDRAATELTERYVDYYKGSIAVETRLFPNALNAMQALFSDGWTLAVCTNKRESLARQLLEAIKIDHHFAAICGGDTFDYRKPDGRHILSTIAMAGADPDSAVMIGDAEPDVLAAKDAKIPVIAVDFGYGADAVAALSPDALISDFAELPATAETLIERAVA